MAKYFTDGSSTIGVKSAFVVTDENGKVITFEETKNTCHCLTPALRMPFVFSVSLALS